MKGNIEERASLCALGRIFGFEPRVGKALIERFGSAAEVFGQSSKEITAVLGDCSRTRYASRISESAFESAAMELETLEKKGCVFIGIDEPGYPELLRECEDPPLGLYFRGCSEPRQVFGGIPHISVVGTRGLTYYGKDWCQRIVAAMSKAGVRPLVISGLALGVDVTAHKAALENGLSTVAVMATGIDGLYPARNRAVGEQIASTEGCALITDYPPGTEAVRINFLRRNRIIAGIARATILVESKIKGGGMMTARLAASYDRDVFALPGRIDDPVSQGCNMLIRENLAEPIGDLAELMARLGLGRTEIRLKEDFKAEVENLYRDNVSPRQFEDTIKVAMLIKGNRGISIDEICERLKLTYSRVSHLTAILECDGFIGVDLL